MASPLARLWTVGLALSLLFPIQVAQIANAQGGGTGRIIRNRQPASDSPDPDSASEVHAAREFQGRRAGQERDDNGLEMKLVWCPPGKFMMGNAGPDQTRSGDDDRAIAVSITKGFWLGKYEVTQAEWEVTMDTSPWNDSPWKDGSFVKISGDCPATFIDYDGAMAFCRRLTRRESAAGRLPTGCGYTLPTEAQWEYACRAGAKHYVNPESRWSLAEFAWFGAKWGGTAFDEKYAHAVGMKKPNPWGLYDMHGNVEEWCRDIYVKTLPGGIDPEMTSRGSSRVTRGGNWMFGAGSATDRGKWPAGSRTSFLGFRAALCQVR